jgi:hypothetical protein
MKKLTVLCILAALGFSSLHAQNTETPSHSAYDQQQNTMRNQQSVDHDFRQQDRQAFVNSVANTNKLRSKLAEAWQSLGMKPQAAQAVANAYKPNLAGNVHHADLHGKSGQEVAAMLQSALAKKDYMLANQTLIDYQREQMHLGSNSSPTGRH